MNNQKIGEFIQLMRKDKKLTQEQLANLIGVSNKAVSKWERGLSFPDITLLPSLVSILGITLAEFFAGEKNQKEKINKEELDDLLTKTLVYNTEKNHEKIVKIIVASFAVLAILSIMICFIIDFAINQSLGWSLIVAGGLLLPLSILGAYMIIPKYKVMMTIWFAGFATILFLLLIQSLTFGGNWVLLLGIPIVILSCCMLSIFYFFSKLARFKENIFYQLALDLLVVTILGELGVKLIISFTVSQNTWDWIITLITTLGMIAGSIILALIGSIYSRKMKRQ